MQPHSSSKYAVAPRRLHVASSSNSPCRIGRATCALANMHVPELEDAVGPAAPAATAQTLSVARALFGAPTRDQVESFFAKALGPVVLQT
eukprot:XP_001693566.1 predicted protein [Chlamydomonas reinhardtii]